MHLNHRCRQLRQQELAAQSASQPPGAAGGGAGDAADADVDMEAADDGDSDGSSSKRRRKGRGRGRRRVNGRGRGSTGKSRSRSRSRSRSGAGAGGQGSSQGGQGKKRALSYEQIIALRKQVAGQYRGVQTRRHFFVIRIMVNGESRQHGQFETPEEAAHAYDKYAKKAFGDRYACKQPHALLLCGCRC